MTTTFKNYTFFQKEIHPIEIQVQILQGMPDFQIIGLGSTAIKETKERSRAAIKNLGYKFPIQRKIINLSPAHLPKSGTHTDLAIILGLLAESNQITFTPPSNTLFLGEVTLDAKLKPIPNLIPILKEAKNSGIQNVYLPADNLPEASLIPELNYYPVDNLNDIIKGTVKKVEPKAKEPNFIYPTFDDIINQNIAKRALTIAIAGHHHLLLTGSPGQGKSILAESSQNLSPCTFHKVDSSVTKSVLHGTQKSSTTGLLQNCHYGTLVLNELPECKRDILESLKEPLEQIPFTFIATMNPCHCGFRDDHNKACFCTDYDTQRYRSKLSGSLLDRFDLSLQIISEPSIQKPNSDKSLTKKTYNQVQKVKLLQQQRGTVNSHLSHRQIINASQLSSKALNLLSVIEAKFKVSTRRLVKLAQVARTIADLEVSPKVEEEHLAESFGYQKRLIT